MEKEKFKALLAAIIPNVTAEIREAWLDVFPEDATKEEAENRDKNRPKSKATK